MDAVAAIVLVACTAGACLCGLLLVGHLMERDR